MKRNKLSKIRKSLIKCIDWIDNITGEFYHHPIPPPPLHTLLRSGNWYNNTKDKIIYVYFNKEWHPIIKCEKHTTLNHRDLAVAELENLKYNDIQASSDKKSVIFKISDSDYEKSVKFYYVINGEKIYLDVIKTLGDTDFLSHTPIKKANIKTGFVCFDSEGENGSNGYAYAQLLLSSDDYEFLFLFSSDCDIPVDVSFEVDNSSIEQIK